jgi:internalin A
VDLSGIPERFQGSISADGRVAKLSVLDWAQVPDWVTNLTSLTALLLGGNRLTRLPETIGNLTELATAHLGGNDLAELPDTVGNLAELSELYLYENQLTRVPKTIGNLTNLTKLDLHGNRLTRLPETIGNLTNLTELDLHGNRLTRLPETIGNLTNLTELDLHGNRLTELPVGLAKILGRSLHLQLEGNPLGDPLPELVQRGNVALADYLRSLPGAGTKYEGKLLLVGEGNVGKSSLVAALKGDRFVVGRPTTHGIEISAIQFRHPKLDLDMTLRAWDFGGQEVYRVSHQFFFSTRALYLVVWHSRESAEQDEVVDWLRRIRLRVGDGAVVIVVATHCKERLPDLDYAHLERLFPGLVAGAYEVDSSDGTGIGTLRRAISKHAARLPQMGQKISPRWSGAREAVLALANTKPQIHYDKFAKICERQGVTGTEIGTLARLLHDLGLVIYYDEDEGLKDVVVLNPEWLTKAISYVLDDRVTTEAGGVLDHKRLKAIWQDRDGGYDAKYHPYFLRLMEKFDISYRLDDDEYHSLVPQLVPHQRPALPWQFRDPCPPGLRTLMLTCHLTEAAPGLIPWITAQHHHASTDRHWRRGVFLRHPIDAYRSEALVELVRENELAFEVRAPSPDLYFNVLRESIEKLIRNRWPGLNYRFYVPCPATVIDETHCAGRFALDGLIRVREGGKASTVSCMDCGELFQISTLLTGFTASDEPLVSQLEHMNDRLANMASTVGIVNGQAAEIADTVRRVNRTLTTEVKDCPRLFTLGKMRPRRAERVRFHQDHYQLTLWCEHPGEEHPWASATYDLHPPKEWFTQIAPYARIALRTLQLAVPVAAAIEVASLPAALRENAQTRLEVMKAIVDDIPDELFSDVGAAYLPESRVRPAGLTRAEGRALRAVRQAILEKDPAHGFGDMRRVQSPAGDLLWVCPAHYTQYDPGLPTLP